MALLQREAVYWLVGLGLAHPVVKRFLQFGDAALHEAEVLYVRDFERFVQYVHP